MEYKVVRLLYLERRANLWFGLFGNTVLMIDCYLVRGNSRFSILKLRLTVWMHLKIFITCSGPKQNDIWFLCNPSTCLVTKGEHSLQRVECVMTHSMQTITHRTNKLLQLQMLLLSFVRTVAVQGWGEGGGIVLPAVAAVRTNNHQVAHVSITDCSAFQWRHETTK